MKGNIRDYSLSAIQKKCIVIIRLPNGRIATNVPHRVVIHSSGGYEIGYGGSGPADLALNILLMVTTDELASRWYQKFKLEFIARLPEYGGIIPLSEIRRWIKHNEALFPA